MLVLLLALGHACELPALAELVSHATEDTHHPADNHANENLLSCDAVGVPSSTGYQQPDAGPDVAAVFPVAGPNSAPLLMSFLGGSSRRPSRPPLYLLYASLLI